MQKNKTGNSSQRSLDALLLISSELVFCVIQTLHQIIIKLDVHENDFFVLLHFEKCRNV